MNKWILALVVSGSICATSVVVTSLYSIPYGEHLTGASLLLLSTIIILGMMGPAPWEFR